MNYDEQLANWANLTKEQRIALMHEERKNRPTDEKAREALYHANFDACRQAFVEYLEGLGPFEIVADHNHAFDVTSKWSRSNLIRALSFSLTGWLMIHALPVAQHTIAEHRAGKTLTVFSEALRCHSCGVHSHLLEITGTKLKPLMFRQDTRTELGDCPIDATQPYSVELDVPSGEMVVANHLAPLFDAIKDPYAPQNDINYVWGRKNCTEEYAKQGYIELNIGNCGCHLIQTDKAGTTFIMCEHTDATDGLEVARVCTDFRGYGIADHENAKRRGLVEKMTARDYTIVKCAPGRYRFTHRYHLLRDGLSDDGIFTHIEMLRHQIG